MTNRRLINRIRALCIAVAVLAFLMYVNTSQMDEDSEASMYTIGALNTNMAQVLNTRRTQVATTAWVEYAAMVSASYAILLAIAAPRLLNFRSERRVQSRSV